MRKLKINLVICIFSPLILLIGCGQKEETANDYGFNQIEKSDESIMGDTQQVPPNQPLKEKQFSKMTKYGMCDGYHVFLSAVFQSGGEHEKAMKELDIVAELGEIGMDNTEFKFASNETHKFLLNEANKTDTSSIPFFHSICQSIGY